MEHDDRSPGFDTVESQLAAVLHDLRFLHETTLDVSTVSALVFETRILEQMRKKKPILASRPLKEREIRELPRVLNHVILFEICNSCLFLSKKSFRSRFIRHYLVYFAPRLGLA